MLSILLLQVVVVVQEILQMDLMALVVVVPEVFYQIIQVFLHH